MNFSPGGLDILGDVVVIIGSNFYGSHYSFPRMMAILFVFANSCECCHE